MKLKPSQNGKITLVIYWYTYIMPKSRISNVTNMSFNAIRENKILTKFPNLQYPITMFKGCSSYTVKDILLTRYAWQSEGLMNKPTFSSKLFQSWWCNPFRSFFCLIWFFTSQSRIFQLRRDGSSTWPGLKQGKPLQPWEYYQGTKKIQYCTCPARRVTYSFHSSCKHVHLSFKSVCNKEHKGVIWNLTSSSNSSQSTRPTWRVLGKNYLSFLDFTRNYERTSGIFVPWLQWHIVTLDWPLYYSHNLQLPSEDSVEGATTTWTTYPFGILASSIFNLSLNIFPEKNHFCLEGSTFSSSKSFFLIFRTVSVVLTFSLRSLLSVESRNFITTSAPGWTVSTSCTVSLSLVSSIRFVGAPSTYTGSWYLFPSSS